ncbi:MAG: phosphoenolpyruvate-protein phosphotransferase PtsP, partial [Alphaproteobacteria bacterium]|nr:phosphoenolpyruvate-protein phosphotransferase PtsP [Alphaproteobacteria bacterium]
QHRTLYGILTVQQEESRFFDDAEESFLITLASQLGGSIAQADATGELSCVTSPKNYNISEENRFMQLSGIGCVPGIAVGTAILIYPKADIDAVLRTNTNDTDNEVTILYEAMGKARTSMRRLRDRMKTTVGDKEQALFDVYLQLMADDHLGVEIEKMIRLERVTAETGLALVIKKHVFQFEQMQDEYLKERASDVRDIGNRILVELQNTNEEEITYPRRTVIVGEEITAATLAEIPQESLAGVISVKGSHNSHVAILARAMGIPTIMGIRGLKFEQIHKKPVILDGYSGFVLLSPSKALLQEYKLLMVEEKELYQSLETLRDHPAETKDHHRISLQVNTGLAMDAGLSMSVGAEGIGLYRSEIPFMHKERFPSEDEQYIIYKQILKAFAPRPVTMRTLDIGGDKTLSYFPVEEENPYLGWRGIRITLDQPDVFLIQVRAMLRANENLQNLRIMLPMVTNIQEVDEAFKLIDKAHSELIEEGLMIVKPPLGIMIEVPAAMYQIEALVKRVSFISIGSNDLTQYLLAVDRNNARVASLYDGLHPSMIYVLRELVQNAKKYKLPVSICGELASDPLAVVLLIAMGFDTLSMNSSSLPKVKWIIRSFTMQAAQEILNHVMTLEDSCQIRKYMNETLEEYGLGGLLRAGKQ